MIIRPLFVERDGEMRKNVIKKSVLKIMFLVLTAAIFMSGCSLFREKKAESGPVHENPYADTDFSVPEGFDEVHDGVDYGVMNDRVSYYSSTIGENKMCGVLLPEGYDESKSYPVVYVLHGFGGDHFDWSRDDSYLAPIYGNMLAAGTAVPMIIVTVDMYTAPEATKETATREEMREAYDNLVNDLENDLMPFIESNYAVKTGRENTGIIGTSQGGTESLAIGFLLQDKIGYISSLAPCPGVIPTDFNVGTYWNTPIMEDFNIESEESEPLYLALMAGDKDPWCFESTVFYHEKLEEKGIKHGYTVIEGSGHDDDVWKSGLYNFFKRIF